MDSKDWVYLMVHLGKVPLVSILSHSKGQDGQYGLGISNGTLGEGPIGVYLVPQYIGTRWTVGIGLMVHLGKVGKVPLMSILSHST